MAGSERRDGVGGGDQQRALVLGASGHIGSAVVRELLVRGSRVTAARRGRTATRNLAGLAVRDVLGDGDCAETLDAWVRGHDVVIDAAAPYPMTLADGGAISASARRAALLVEAVARHRARLVHIGSFVTRDASSGLGDELHPYFAAKRAGEAVFAAAARTGAPITVVHPTACIGPWDTRPSATCLVPMVLAGQLPVVPAQLINVIDVRDVARAVAAISAEDARGEPLMLSGHNVGLPELCALIGELAGTRVAVRGVPAMLTRPGAWAAELASLGTAPPLLLLIALLTLRQKPLSVCASQRALGAAPRPLSATLRDAIAWHQGAAMVGDLQREEDAVEADVQDARAGVEERAANGRARVRRPTPVRTEPVRAMSGMFRTGTKPVGRSSDSDEDPVSRAVRAGCDVVANAVQRGRGPGHARSEPQWAAWAARLVNEWLGATMGVPRADERMGSPEGSRGSANATSASANPWSAGRWVDAMASAFTQWAQHVNTWSTVARGPGAGADPDAAAWASPFRAVSAAESNSATSPWPSPFRAASAPEFNSTTSPWPSPFRAAPTAKPAETTDARKVRVELRTARAAAVDLELAPGAGPELEIHGLVAAPTLAAPPITDATIAVTDDGIAIELGALEHHPAGTYTGAVIAAGRACGTLTVRLS